MALTVITSTTETPRKKTPSSTLPGGLIDPSQEAYMYEEWLSSTPENGTYRIGNNFWQWDVSGGTVGPATGESSALGAVNLSVTNGRAAVHQTLDAIGTGGGTITFQTRVKIPTLATTAQAFYTGAGLGDSPTATQSVDAILFQHDQTSGNWICKTRSNSSETSTTTTSAIVANTWYTLKAVINSTATEVKFYVGTTGQNLTLVATHTTNIPTGTGRDVGCLLKIIKTNGNTTRSFYCDYYFIRILLASPR